MRGIVATTAVLDLEIIEAELVGPRQNESVTVSEGKKELNFYINLTHPGDERVIRFKIANTGSLSARLGTWNLVNIPAAETGIVVQWPELLQNSTIYPGTTTQVYEIKIKWNPDYSNAQSGLASIAATISYAQA